MHTQNNNHIGIVETETEASPKCATRPNGLPSAHLSAIASAAAEGRGTEGEGEQRVQTIQDSAFSSPRVNRKSSIINPNPTPRGKVAHLPKIIRDQVNQMLDDGVTFRKIARKLTELGHPGFFYQNIQRWKTGGYRLSLDEQRRRELDKLELEAALDRLAADPNAATTLAEANEIKLALKNSRLLNQIHDWPAETLLLQADNAKTFFQLSRSVNRQLGERTRRERTLFDIDLKRQLHEDKLKSSGRYPGFQPGYSRETAREMERTFEGALSFQPSNTVPIVNGEPSAAPPSPLNEERAGERGEAVHLAPGCTTVPLPIAPPQSATDSLADSVTSHSRPLASISGSTPQSDRHAPTRYDTTETNPAAPAPSEISNLKCQISPSEIQPSTNPPPSAPRSHAPALHAFPISPLSPLNTQLSTARTIPAQPPHHLPVFDSFGAWISWIPCSGPGSLPSFYDAILFENTRDQPVCWINPKRIEEQSDPPPDRLLALLDADGRILKWIPQTDPLAPPLRYTFPIRCRRFRYMTAWIHDPPYDSNCGGAVAYEP